MRIFAASFRERLEVATSSPRLTSIRRVLTGSTGFESGSPKSGKVMVPGKPMSGSPIMNLRMVATTAAVRDPAALTHCIMLVQYFFEREVN